MSTPTDKIPEEFENWAEQVSDTFAAQHGRQLADGYHTDGDLEMAHKEGCIAAYHHLSQQPGLRWVDGSECLPEIGEEMPLLINMGDVDSYGLGGWDGEMFKDEIFGFRHPRNKVKWLEDFDESPAPPTEQKTEEKADSFACFLDKLIAREVAAPPEIDSLSGCEYSNSAAPIIRTIREEYLRLTGATAPSTVERASQPCPVWKKVSDKFPEEWRSAIIRIIATKELLTEHNVKEAEDEYFFMEDNRRDHVYYTECEWLDESAVEPIAPEEKERAIAFDIWKNKGWERLYDDVYQGIYSGEKKTTSELYDLFIQQSQK